MKSPATTRFRFSAPLSRLLTLITAFRSNRRGNVAIMTAIAALPLVAAVGCVVDYSTASLIKTKLQAAADAAALATISHNSSIITTAQNMSGSGAVSGGSTAAVAYFNANLSSAPADVGYTNLNPTASVTRSGLTLTANIAFTAKVPTLFMGVMGYKNILVSGSSTASYTLPGYINFYLMLDVSGSMSFPSTSDEQTRLMSVNPDNLHGTNGYPQGCQFACHFARQGTCAQTGSGAGPWQGAWPYYVTVTVKGKNGSTTQENIGQDIPSEWPSGYPGGYCMGFIISRLGTTPATLTGCSATDPNDANPPAAPSGHIPGTTSTAYPSGCGQYVNWNNSQVSSCSSPGTTSCIQLRADAVGYAVSDLLTYANQYETNDNITDQYQVGLFPFIVNLCTSNANSSNSCSVGLTDNLTGSTITTFAQQLASLLDTGQDPTLGSGGTHFENALSQMNGLITSVGSGSSSSDALPYVFIVTDGSQDYQTQSNGSWGSENGSGSWVATSPSLPCTQCGIPNQNSATVMPGFSPNNEPNSTNYCTTLKNRGITIAILYIPYTTISDPNTNFAGNEDGYANANIANIPAALQGCASPNFFFTANSPTDIDNTLKTMFNQAVSTAHLTN